MTPIVVSPFDAGFNAALAALPCAPTVLAALEDEPWAAPPEADVLLVRPSPAWRGARAQVRPAGWPGRLLWACSAAVGVDVYPRWLLDVPLVSCGRGVASEQIADYVIGAIYAQIKNVMAVQVHAPAEWRPAELNRVYGSTVGIIGLGSIGTAVARRALALGARVTATRRRRGVSPVAGVDLLDEPAQVVASADHLLLALPATERTSQLVGRALLAHARPTAHLVNVGRGAVLDQEALLHALDAGRLGFATLDVTEPEPLPAGHPLWTHPRVRLTPHVSAGHPALRDRLFGKIAADLERFARGEPPHDLVDAAAGY